MEVLNICVLCKELFTMDLLQCRNTCCPVCSGRDLLRRLKEDADRRLDFNQEFSTIIYRVYPIEYPYDTDPMWNVEPYGLLHELLDYRYNKLVEYIHHHYDSDLEEKLLESHSKKLYDLYFERLKVIRTEKIKNGV